MEKFKEKMTLLGPNEGFKKWFQEQPFRNLDLISF